MNTEGLIKIENQRHDRAIKNIEACRGLGEYIRNISPNGIWCETFSISEISKVLHIIGKKLGRYKISDYFMGVDRIVVEYSFGQHKFFIGCNEPDNMLKKISSGKCKIVNVTSTNQTVVCDL